jgi:hypothetical protein
MGLIVIFEFAEDPVQVCCRRLVDRISSLRTVEDDRGDRSVTLDQDIHLSNSLWMQPFGTPAERPQTGRAELICIR